MTFSIVARDPETGDLGVAVETAMFAVGALVPWCRPGVGVVASQAIADPSYGPRCLDAMADGATAGEALAAARALDPLPALRQVAVLDAHGGVAVDTGALCIDHAGHVVGDGFAVQANMMTTPDVWSAMAAAFTSARGPLARRLHAALVAGGAAGGDARGECSAALVVVRGEPVSQPPEGVLTDVRVDRSADPIGALGLLLDAAEAYAGFTTAVDQLMSGRGEQALETIDLALRLLPGDENLRFARAGALAATGDQETAAAELRALVAARPSWEVAIRSFADKGFVALPEGTTIDAVLSPGVTDQDAG